MYFQLVDNQTKCLSTQGQPDVFNLCTALYLVVRSPRVTGPRLYTEVSRRDVVYRSNLRQQPAAGFKLVSSWFHVESTV